MPASAAGFANSSHEGVAIHGYYEWSAFDESVFDDRIGFITTSLDRAQRALHTADQAISE